MEEFYDTNHEEIKHGDVLYNRFNDPPRMRVWADENNILRWEDDNTPLNEKYQFHRFWTVVMRDGKHFTSKNRNSIK